jgi:hypothetical protein
MSESSAQYTASKPLRKFIWEASQRINGLVWEGLYAAFASYEEATRVIPEEDREGKHDPLYISLIMELAGDANDQESARDFAKHFVEKPAAFSTTKLGRSALRMEMWIRENGGLFAKRLLEIVLAESDPTYLLIFEGAIADRDYKRMEEQVVDFAKISKLVTAGDINVKGGTVSDVTIIEVTPVARSGQGKSSLTFGGSAKAFGKPGDFQPPTNPTPTGFGEYPGSSGFDDDDLNTKLESVDEAMRQPTAHCYSLAADWVVNGKSSIAGREGGALPKSAKLVQGYPHLQRPPFKKYGHAWVEVGNMVYDATHEPILKMPKAVYYALGNIDPKDNRYYKQDKAREVLLSCGHWGPWRSGTKGIAPGDPEPEGTYHGEDDIPPRDVLAAIRSESVDEQWVAQHKTPYLVGGTGVTIKDIHPPRKKKPTNPLDMDPDEFMRWAKKFESDESTGALRSNYGTWSVFESPSQVGGKSQHSTVILFQDEAGALEVPLEEVSRMVRTAFDHYQEPAEGDMFVESLLRGVVSELGTKVVGLDPILPTLAESRQEERDRVVRQRGKMRLLGEQAANDDEEEIPDDSVSDSPPEQEIPDDRVSDAPPEPPSTDRTEKPLFYRGDLQDYYDTQIISGADQAEAIKRLKSKFKLRQKVEVTPTGEVRVKGIVDNPKPVVAAPPPMSGGGGGDEPPAAEPDEKEESIEESGPTPTGVTTEAILKEPVAVWDIVVQLDADEMKRIDKFVFSDKGIGKPRRDRTMGKRSQAVIYRVEDTSATRATERVKKELQRFGVRFSKGSLATPSHKIANSSMRGRLRTSASGRDQMDASYGFPPYSQLKVEAVATIVEARLVEGRFDGGGVATPIDADVPGGDRSDDNVGSGQAPGVRGGSVSHPGDGGMIPPGRPIDHGDSVTRNKIGAGDPEALEREEVLHDLDNELTTPLDPGESTGPEYADQLLADLDRLLSVHESDEEMDEGLRELKAKAKKFYAWSKQAIEKAKVGLGIEKVETKEMVQTFTRMLKNKLGLGKEPFDMDRAPSPQEVRKAVRQLGDVGKVAVVSAVLLGPLPGDEPLLILLEYLAQAVGMSLFPSAMQGIVTFKREGDDDFDGFMEDNYSAHWESALDPAMIRKKFSAGLAEKASIIDEEAVELTQEQKQTHRRWKRLVNMTSESLRAFFRSPQLQEVLKTSRNSKTKGIRLGIAEARRLLAMKNRPVAEWDEGMWRTCHKQIQFIERTRRNEAPIFDDLNRPTRKTYTLRSWGHDPVVREDIEETHLLARQRADGDFICPHCQKEMSEGDFSFKDGMWEHLSCGGVIGRVPGPTTVGDANKWIDATPGQPPYYIGPLSEARPPNFAVLRANHKSISSKEAVRLLSEGHSWPGDTQPAIWEASVDGRRWFVANNHRAYIATNTVEGAEGRFKAYLRHTQ